MKNKKLNIIVLILALLLVLYFSLKEDFFGVLNNLSNVKIQYFALAIIVFMLSLFFKSFSLRLYLSKYYDNYSLKNAYSLTLIGQFLNGITPFQSGGQPFQIYLLKKDGKRVTDSTSAMLKDSLSYQIALITIGFVSLMVNCILKIYNDSSLNFLVLVGFVINFIVFLFLIFLIKGRKKGVNLVSKIIDFLCRFRIMKRLDNKKEDIKNSLNRFYKLLGDVKKDYFTLTKAVIYNIINFLLLYSVPYFIFLSLGCNNINLPITIFSTSFIMLIANFIPIPGATGGIEYGFYRFFGYYISGNLLTSAMLLWRFVTYILGMFVGFVTLIIWKGKRK